MSNNSGGSGGIGFLGLLAVLFIGLKLAGVITWSWFWVLSPLFVVPGVLLVGAIIYVIVHKVLRS